MGQIEKQTSFFSLQSKEKRVQKDYEEAVWEEEEEEERVREVGEEK